MEAIDIAASCKTIVYAPHTSDTHLIVTSFLPLFLKFLAELRQRQELSSLHNYMKENNVEESQAFLSFLMGEGNIYRLGNSDRSALPTGH